MADVVLLTAIISLVSILLILLTLLKSRVSKDDNEESAVPREQVRRPVAVDRENPRPIRARRNRLRPSQVTRQQEENEEEDEEAEDPLAEHIALPEGKIGAKKRKKLEMKAEKRAQREMEEQEREERRQRQALLEEQRQKQEQKEREEEAKREEEERLRKEELKRQEHEEYLKLKESFNVEDEGYEENETEKEGHDLLKEFVDYIKKNKVVLMEDLATHFKMKTQDAINRVQTLQASGRLSGVVDDRGKFIYISKEELEAVAKFIRQRGRVSVAELVENSNLLINLNPAMS